MHERGGCWVNLSFRIVGLLSICVLLTSCQTVTIPSLSFFNEIDGTEDSKTEKNRKLNEISLNDEISLNVQDTQVDYLPFVNRNLGSNVTLAIANSPDILARLKEASAAKDLIKVESSAKRVQSSAQLTSGFVSESGSTDPALVASLSVSKLLYDFGRADSNILTKTENFKVTELAAVIEAELIALEAVTAWIIYHEKLQIEKIYERGLTMARPLLGQIKNISTSGLVDKASLLEAKKKYTTLETLADQAKLATAAAGVDFKNVYRFNAPRNISSVLPIEVEEPTGSLEEVFQGSPGVKIINHRIYSKAAEMKSVQLTEKPIISAVGSITAPAQDIREDGVANVGLLLNHTFNDGGRRIASISGLEAELEALKQQRKSTIEKLLSDFNQQSILLEGARREKQSLEEILQIALEVRDAARGQLVSGRSSIEDVLAAEIGLAEVQIGLISVDAQISQTSFRRYALQNGLTSLFNWSKN